jgi:hypothetical protein
VSCACELLSRAVCELLLRAVCEPRSRGVCELPVCELRVWAALASCVCEPCQNVLLGLLLHAPRLLVALLALLLLALCLLLGLALRLLLAVRDRVRVTVRVRCVKLRASNLNDTSFETLTYWHGYGVPFRGEVFKVANTEIYLTYFWRVIISTGGRPGRVERPPIHRPPPASFKRKRERAHFSASHWHCALISDCGGGPRGVL